MPLLSTIVEDITSQNGSRTELTSPLGHHGGAVRHKVERPLSLHVDTFVSFLFSPRIQ